MKRRAKLKYYWLSIILTMGVLIAYKAYLLIYDTDYEALNATQIEQIKSRTKKSNRYSFAVIGNIKNSMRNMEKRIVPLMQDNEVSFMISAGNAVYDGAESKYRLLRRGLSKTEIPYIISPGNNEIEDFGAPRFYHHFGPYYYSFALNDSYFVLLDGSGESSWKWQYSWLRQELERAQSYRHRFIVLSHSVVPVAGFNREDSPYEMPDELEKNLQQLFSQYEVTAVFSSDYPVFQNTLVAGVPYIMTGAGGGLLLSKENGYQFTLVSVNMDEVRYTNIPIPNQRGFLRSEFESLKLYLYSLFYMSYFNAAILIGILSLLAIKVHNIINRQKHLYRDFSFDESLSEAPLRIAMFSNNYLPFIGGVPLSIQRLYRGLSSSGMIVKLFVPSYRQDQINREKETVFRCTTLFSSRTGSFPVANIFSAQIKKQFKRFDSDIVHVHHPFWLGRKGLKLARKRGIPVVFTYHTRLEYYTHYIPLPSETLKNLFVHYMIKRFANQCDAIITPTISTEEYLRNLGVSALIETIPTGIDIDAYQQSSNQDIQAYRKLYLEADERLLITVSRLAKEKNLDFLIAGLKKLMEQTEISFKCLIIGDGPEKQHLKNLVGTLGMNDSIIFAGSQPPETVIQSYQAADIFVFSSTSETQGMVLLEAMAAGCPVVAVRASGVHEIVKDGYNGFKVEESTDAWALAIRTLLEDSKLLALLSDNSRTFATRYSIKNISDTVLRLYRRVIVLNKSHTQ